MTTREMERELKHICHQFQLKSIYPAPLLQTVRRPGFKIVAAPECYTSLTNFLCYPSQNDNISEVIMPKTEPIDHLENDEYYEDSALEVDIPMKATGNYLNYCRSYFV
jgi:hypothetical protein